MKDQKKAILLIIGILIIGIVAFTLLLPLLSSLFQMIFPFAIIAIILFFIKYAFPRIIQFLEKKLEHSYYSSFYTILFLGYLIMIGISTLIICFLLEFDVKFSETIFIIIINAFLSILYTYLYFLPYFTAVKKNHVQTRAIYILNLLAGWTIFAWIIAIIWANTVSEQKPIIEQKITSTSADELIKYKELLDKGIITQEEFDAKKKQLLDI